ncbi:class I adenylate-forming enzyme family protein [Nocardioides sp. cx-173]|uniref:class I adenylate-forming enzyme family protein n=1 Tax=Nocardioides sp. cx-173 TaxID=2898796 RepID=UPI001E501169|nr:AMP-binding protein [Nocardioides sp. cx-173]MCD4524353.1 AMP-binding protein [Nocardioides sp. cx-173]UGB43159.1 AMP-binding protein [Nocardioides sp. cx-173]
MPIHPGGAALSIAAGVREFGRATPGATAVIDGDRKLTFAALDERSSRVAQALLTAGLAPGERVAVLLGNRLEYPELAAGIAKAGLVMVPLNPRLTASEARFILEHSGARAVVLDDALAGIVGDAVTELGLLALCLDGTQLGPSYDAVLETSRAADPQVAVAELDPFCIAYTSGTTGRPKGVLISHRSRALTFYLSALEWGLGPGRRSAAVAPMYHGAGFAFGYAPVFAGGTVSMLRSWDPEEFLRLAERDRVQSTFLVPTHAQMLRALGEGAVARHDLSALDTLYFNAAALPWTLKQWVMAEFAQCGIHELYGSTESGIITNLRPVDQHTRPGSVGHAWFLTELRVVDEHGAPVGPGEPGELFSRSPFLMNGYHDDPEATAACTTEDGFVTCGDVVVRDEDGYVHIVDRLKDLIISGGLNVYPREVEDVLREHPAVVDVAVIGVPSTTWGEEVAAYVVLRGALDDACRDSLSAHCRDRLAGYKMPRHWDALEALPRNAGGKVLKRELRAGLVTTD